MDILMSQGLLQCSFIELRYWLTYSSKINVEGGRRIKHLLTLHPKLDIKMCILLSPFSGLNTQLYETLAMLGCWSPSWDLSTFPALVSAAPAAVWRRRSLVVELQLLMISLASLENWLHELSPWMPRAVLLQCRGGTVCKFPEYCKFRINYLSCAVRRH